MILIHFAINVMCINYYLLWTGVGNFIPRILGKSKPNKSQFNYSIDWVYDYNYWYFTAKNGNDIHTLK